jgi:hypothetical protein
MEPEESLLCSLETVLTIISERYKSRNFSLGNNLNYFPRYKYGLVQKSQISDCMNTLLM